MSSETTVATYSGDRNGLSEVAAAPALTELAAPQQPANTEQVLRLHPEHPFGVTVIIGGTNVRFCLSVPDRTEPIIDSIRWTQLRDELAPELEKAGKTFEKAHERVYAYIAEKFADFVLKHSPEGAKAPPFQNLCAFNFSIAGIVSGEGMSAKVSTSNTGIPMAEELIATRVLGAVNSELAKRNWAQVKCENVSVMNDAAAGLMGERLGGALQGVDDGLYIILGTGVGSYGLVNGKLASEFAELGHRVTRSEATENYRYYNDSELSEILDEHNQFKPQSTEQWYAENELAGPWAAVKFIKHAKNIGPLYRHLVDQVAKSLATQRSPKEVAKILSELADLKYADVSKWAVSSPSDVIKAVASILFDHNAKDIAQALECDMNITLVAERGAKLRSVLKTDITRLNNSIAKLERDREALEKDLVGLPDGDEQRQEIFHEITRHRNEVQRLTEKLDRHNARADRKLSKALTLSAYTQWQTYFKELSKFVSTSYEAMQCCDVVPQRIVIAGGIGELCSRYDSIWKERIYEIFDDFAEGVPAGTIAFSTMSPEAREAFITTSAVQAAFEEHKKKVAAARALTAGLNGAVVH